MTKHLQIKSHFKLNEHHILLSLRGFGLTPETPITLLRDGDIVVVTADNKLEVAFCSSCLYSDLGSGFSQLYEVAALLLEVVLLKMLKLFLQLAGTSLDLGLASVVGPNHTLQLPSSANGIVPQALKAPESVPKQRHPSNLDSEARRLVPHQLLKKQKLEKNAHHRGTFHTKFCAYECLIGHCLA